MIGIASGQIANHGVEDTLRHLRTAGPVEINRHPFILRRFLSHAAAFWVVATTEKSAVAPLQQLHRTTTIRTGSANAIHGRELLSESLHIEHRVTLGHRESCREIESYS